LRLPPLEPYHDIPILHRQNCEDQRKHALTRYPSRSMDYSR